jgi:hypothetical protein
MMPFIIVMFVFVGVIGIGYGYIHRHDYENSKLTTFNAVPSGVLLKYDFAPELIPLLESGSSAPYSFYLGSGVGFPPMGLTLGIDGVLSGTPTGTGASKFQVCVKDVGGRSTCKTYSMSVAPKTTPAATPKTSCPANSHQSPSDSNKCLCDTGYETNSTGNGCVIVSTAPLNATFDIKISSLTCTLTDIIKGGAFPYVVTYNRVIVSGTAQGPVGALVELPILGWSDDVWDCGDWTLTTGAYIAVGCTCTREEGQPETTTWAIDTGGEETGGYERGETESYVAKIYSKDLFAENLVPRKEDKASTVCQ